MNRQMVWVLGLLCALVMPARAATVEYIHTDALGTPVAVTDASRNVIERSEYEPYGALLNRPVKDGPGYTGHVMDAATGLTYMQQRYYDPGIGRFLSVDPVTVDGNSGANFNRYWYANNNPYKFTDPDGRLPIIIPIVIVAYKMYSAYDTASSTVSNARILGDANASTGAKIQAGAEIVGGLAGGKVGRQAAGGTAKIAGNVGTLRNPNKLAPYKDPVTGKGADGPHTSFRTNSDGKVTNYETYDANPNTGGFGAEKRFRGEGKPHAGQEPPLILERPGAGTANAAGPGARPVVPREPRPDELPRGY